MKYNFVYCGLNNHVNTLTKEYTSAVPEYFSLLNCSYVQIFVGFYLNIFLLVFVLFVKLCIYVYIKKLKTRALGECRPPPRNVHNIAKTG